MQMYAYRKCTFPKNVHLLKTVCSYNSIELNVSVHML